jgi:tRNA A-37 threonylcarbamoyl transferase component Bud32
MPSNGCRSSEIRADEGLRFSKRGIEQPSAHLVDNMNEAEIRERIQHYARFPHCGKLNIIADTTEFMSIKPGDVLELGGSYYLVRGEEMEGRFGLDGEPKFWVKRGVDLSDGSIKVIKLVFHETFMMQLGVQKIQCFRSPRKEARILDKIRNDLHFMQGFNVLDSAGNPVRIIERIQGNHFLDCINNLTMDHETYFHRDLPGIFKNVITSVEAINRLHRLGEVHGDIRNDHLLLDRKTGIYTWIDFDYSYDWAEKPFGVDLFGLGNILLLTVGKGFHNLPDLAACGPPGMKVVSCLDASDLSLFFKHRIINLQKLFPYIPDSVNNVLLHFCHGARVFYDDTEELLHDLRACVTDLDH